jgi:DNA helicase II / ATP-dependent DNA helicase PcrA
MLLDPRQAEAVETDGIQLILAGPGSGKTRVITEKIARLLEGGVDPDAILALTYSEKAAQEMADRCAERTGRTGVAVHTFHSFCLQVIRDHVLESGIATTAGVISKPNQLAWGLRNIDAFGFSTIAVGNNAAAVIEAVLEGISAFRDEAIGSDDLARYLAGRGDDGPAGRLRDLLAVYRAYEQHRRAERLVDYADMVHGAVLLLERRPEVRHEYRARYRHILVDEFQDTNWVQLRLLKLLAGDHLCVVGDDDQTIYRFRGAYLTNLDDVKRTWPNCRETLLDRNYRSTSTILALALRLMQSAPNRTPKAIGTANPEGEPVVLARCANEEAQAVFVRDEIAVLLETGFLPRRESATRRFRHGDIAVLCRKREQGVALAHALARHGIPCTYRGEVDLFRLPETRGVLAWLRAVDNPCAAGASLHRLMRAAGIPEPAVQHLHAGARRYADPALGDDGVWAAMLGAAELVPDEAPLVAELARAVGRLIAEKETTPLPVLVHRVLFRGAGLYRRALGRDDTRSVAALNAFYRVAVEYDAATREAGLSDFLEHLRVLAGFPVEVETGPGEDAVQVMTVHKSKGTEFPVVFVLDLSAAHFPLSYREKRFAVPAELARGLRSGDDERALFLQEERRLLYVAMTRAEERLYLTRIVRHGRNRNETKPSVFLRELGVDKTPLVRTVEVDAPVAAGPVAGEPRDSLEALREAGVEQLARAAAEARHTAAFAHLVALERLRIAAGGGDGSAFDPASFLSGAWPTAEVALPGTPPRPAVVPEGFAFSASSLGCYADCPLRFKFEHLLGVPARPGARAGLGSAVHAAIEALSKDLLRGVERDRNEAVAVLEGCWQSSAYASEQHEAGDWRTAVALLDTYLAWQAANRNEIVDVERRFSFPYEDRPVRGSIDRIERRPDGHLVVVDFKTGALSSAPTIGTVQTEVQLNLYALAVAEEFGEFPTEAAYLYLREPRYVPYRPTGPSMGAFLERLSGLVNGVLAAEFPARPSRESCRSCAYRELCADETA